MGTDTRNLRLRVARREPPDLGKLVEWVLNIAETRHRARQAGEPDPYGLPLPAELRPADESARSELLVLSGVRERIEEKQHPRQGGPPHEHHRSRCHKHARTT